MKNDERPLHSLIIEYKVEIILSLIIIFGVIMRFDSFWRYEVVSDGGLYAAGGEGLARLHEFRTLWEPDWPLLGNSITYISYLGLFYSAFGFSVWITKAASLIMGLLVVVVAFLASKNLFGTRKGLIIAAIVSLEPILIWASGSNFTENINLIFVILTIWSGIKAIRNDKRYLMLFGISSGLLYLSRTYVSPIFILLGVVAILVILLYLKGLRILKEKYLIVGFLIFIPFVIIREFLLMTGIQFYQPGINYVSLEFLGALVLFLPVVILLASIYFIFWLPEIREKIRKRNDMENLFLLLTILAFVILLWILTAIIWVTTDEYFRDMIKNDVRYTTVLLIPILWLVFKDMQFFEGSYRKIQIKTAILDKLKSLRKEDFLLLAITLGAAIVVLVFVTAWLSIFLFFGSAAVVIRSRNKRLIIMLVAFLIMSGNIIVTYHHSHVKCAKELNNYIVDGDTLALDGISNYRYYYYSYLDNRDIDVVVYNSSVNADFIASNKNITYLNFEKLGEFRTTVSHTLIQQVWNFLRGRSNSDIETGDVIYLWRRI
jgi:hypothetical protein